MPEMSGSDASSAGGPSAQNLGSIEKPMQWLSEKVCLSLTKLSFSATVSVAVKGAFTATMRSQQAAEKLLLAARCFAEQQTMRMI